MLWLTDYHPVHVYTDMYVCVYVCICWRHVCVHVCTIQNYIAELPVLLWFASVVHFSHDTDLLPTAIQFAWLGYWYHISQKNCLSKAASTIVRVCMQLHVRVHVDLLQLCVFTVLPSYRFCRQSTCTYIIILHFWESNVVLVGKGVYRMYCTCSITCSLHVLE